MIRVTNAHDVVAQKVKYAEYAGLSTDTKPDIFGKQFVSENGVSTEKDILIATGSLFLEVDTGDVYAWDEDGSEWNKVASLGGDA